MAVILNLKKNILISLKYKKENTLLSVEVFVCEMATSIQKVYKMYTIFLLISNNCKFNKIWYTFCILFVYSCTF